MAALTLVEYYYASIFKSHFVILLLGLLLLALVKAGMVGWYFMHLKFEGKWVYVLIVPAMILAMIIVFALTPDMVLKPETEENPGEEYAYIAPADRTLLRFDSPLVVERAAMPVLAFLDNPQGDSYPPGRSPGLFCWCPFGAGRQLCRSQDFAPRWVVTYQPRVTPWGALTDSVCRSFAARSWFRQSCARHG